MLKPPKTGKSFLTSVYGFILYFLFPEKQKHWHGPVVAMKNRLRYILVLFCLLFTAFISSAVAQDAGMEDIEITDSDRDKILLTPGGEGETRYRSPALVTPAKDSIATAAPVVIPAVRKTKTDPNTKPADKQAPPKEDDDSILSFNFLYYVIQKYKLQDIVD